MTKQEQIEEMAKVIPEKIKDPLDNSRYIIFCKSLRREIARIYYNAVYRKIDDKCAVITKDDLNIYKKQAVKEYAEKLKERLCEECSGCYIPNCFETPTDEFAYNAKEVEKNNRRTFKVV